MKTDRYAYASDHLTASFDAQSYAGRLEAGDRYALTPALGVTPYAALQAQSLHTPGYSETDVTGGGLALSYNARTATDTRSELGARFDDTTLLNGMPLVLRARPAWAHDWVSDPLSHGGVPGAARLELHRQWRAAAKRFIGHFGGRRVSPQCQLVGCGQVRR